MKSTTATANINVQFTYTKADGTCTVRRGRVERVTEKVLTIETDGKYKSFSHSGINMLTECSAVVPGPFDRVVG